MRARSASAARSRRRRLAALATVAALWGCGPDGPPTPPATVGTFVGEAECARCHEEAFAATRGTHHDLAMQEATAATVLGDFADATFEQFGQTWRFRRSPDGGFLVETSDGPGGQPASYEIAYAFGVVPLQQYLVRFPGGRMQALTVAWDTRPAEAGGQRWFSLQPEGDGAGHGITADHPLHWTGRNFTWNQMCALCHSTDLRRGYDAATDSYRTTWKDVDVTCEACHGPGSHHVRWADDGADPDEHDGLAVRLRHDVRWSFAPGATIAHREPAAPDRTEVETCAPCHSRRTEIVDGPWHGRPFLDSFRPSLLDRELYFADGQILDEVYVWGSFVQSRMYHAGVTCSDCHDAHSLQLLAPGNVLCIRCHDGRVYDTKAHHLHDIGTSGSACVDCHMPARTYMVVDPRRDHSMRVIEPLAAARIGAPDGCTHCHDDRDAAWAANELARARGDRGPPAAAARFYGDSLRAGRIGRDGAGAALRDVIVDRERPGMARATAADLLGEQRDAPRYLSALRAATRDDDALVRLGAVGTLDRLPAAQRDELAIPALRDPVRAVRAEAARALAEVPAGALPAAARVDFERAFADYVASQELNADRAFGRVNLALALAQRGRTDDAIAQYEAALAEEPRSVRAWVNLADLYRALGRDDDGERVLRRGLEQAFETADLEHALGLLLVRRGQRDEALVRLGRAARLRPEEPRYAYVYGVALQDAGETDAAVAALTDLLRRYPRDTDALLALTTIERDRGRLDEARAWARRLCEAAPEDVRFRELLRSLDR
ncbi:MAG: tetratricopeptide repeat protein [Planctomycetes bacterium]|nr:tetratricopeptide repeat protein [Planctomycetota bacterium]